MASQPYFKSRGLSAEAAEVELLLLRYPNIAEQELTSLVRSLARLPLLDFALLAADPRMGAKLNAIYAAHGDRLRPRLGIMEWAIVALIAAAILVLTIIAVA